MILIKYHESLSLRILIAEKKSKVGFTLSNLFNIAFGVQKGSILGPLLIIIFICDLFLLDKDLNSANCRPQGGFIAPHV